MSTFKRWMILAIVSSALLLIVMDMTILYTALPSLTADLGATASEKLWILNGYSLVMAGLLPAMGTLGDRLGYKRIFTLGLIAFAAASLTAAFAPSPGILVAARVFLAVGAAMMMPATLSIIRVTFTDPRELGLALGIWGSISAGGAGLGPIIGGLLLERYPWGSVFLINIPIALVALILTVIFIPKHAGDREKKWDMLSSVQIMIAMVTMIYAIKEFARRGGSPALATISAVIGVLAFLIFIRRQLRSASPLIDLSLFRTARFTAGFATAMVSSFAQLGVQYLITQRLQLVEGLSPLEAGIFTLCLPLAALIAGPLTGLLTHKYDVLRIQSAGLLLGGFGIGFYLLQLNGAMSGQILGLTLFGAGLGAAMTTASHSIMSNAPAHKAGMAASIEEVAFEMGGASGTAIIGSFAGLLYTLSLKLPGDMQAPAQVYDSLDEALLAAEALPVAVADMLREAGRAAFDDAYVMVVSGAAILLVLGAAVIGWTSRRSSRAGSIGHSR
ncbi:MFS transporter [Paenibacillus tepidiphilus]|uniref:MFS transporter n=1 Tax=Paenibacillus tepidiphilus TaxID=2608683 RepID=UPI00123BA785|nr:MFS transporter [Paenibacillus tepidiphilus]